MRGRFPGSRLRATVVCMALLTIAVLGLGVKADEETHRYVAGEELVLWTNKVGPYNNPQETFKYLSLPFCKAVSALALPHPPYFRL